MGKSSRAASSSNRKCQVDRQPEAWGPKGIRAATVCAASNPHSCREALVLDRVDASQTLQRCGPNGSEARCTQEPPYLHPQQHLCGLGPCWMGVLPPPLTGPLDSHRATLVRSYLSGELHYKPVICKFLRAAGTPTFKAEAPRTTKECLEDIVCIKICAAK